MPEKRIDKRKKTYKEAIKPGLSAELSKTLPLLVDYMDQLNEKKLNDSAELDALVKYYEDSIQELDETEETRTLVSYRGELLKKTRQALSKDLRFIRDYRDKLKNGRINEESALTLDELLEKSRSRIIEVNVNTISKVGAGQNVRSVVPDGGKKLFFTESKKGLGYMESQAAIIENLRQKYGSLVDFLNNSNVKKAADCLADFNLGQDKLRPGVFGTSGDIVGNYTDKLKKYPTVTGKKVDMSYLLEGTMSDRRQTDIFGEYVHELQKFKLSYGMNEGEGIVHKSKHDKRNSAMSKVADMFGRPDLIAHSENVHLKIVDDNKNVVREVLGTGMEEAKGVDSFAADSNNPLINFSTNSLEDSPSLYKDIADLQVIDYICGNADRHTGNVSYIIDKNTNKLVGIQGYDNDSSFGSLFSADGYNFVRVPVDKMSVISKSMAEKIKNTNEVEFRTMLYGYNLSKKEVDASVNRLRNMKQTIVKSEQEYKDAKRPEGFLLKGIPRIVDDDKFGEYSFSHNLAELEIKKDKLGNVVKNGNLFGGLYYSANSPKAGVLLVRDNNYKKLANGCAGLPTSGAINLEKILADMEQVDKKYHTGSENFTNMRNSATALAQKLNAGDFQLFEPVKAYAKDVTDDQKTYRLTHEAQQYKEQLFDAYKKTIKYITEKMDDKKSYKYKQEGTRAWKRFQYALATKKELERQLKIMGDAETVLKDMENVDKIEADIISKNKDLNSEAKKEAERKMRAKIDKAQKQVINDFVADCRNRQEEAAKTNNTSVVFKNRLDELFVTGLMAGAGSTVEELRKKPEEYEKFKLAVASQAVRYKYALEQKSKSDKIDPETKKIVNFQLKFFENVKYDVAKPDESLDRMIKTPEFEKMMNNLNLKVKQDDIYLFAANPLKNNAFKEPFIREVMTQNGWSEDMKVPEEEGPKLNRSSGGTQPKKNLGMKI